MRTNNGISSFREEEEEEGKDENEKETAEQKRLNTDLSILQGRRLRSVEKTH